MVVYRHSLNYFAFFGSGNSNHFNIFVQNGVMTFTEVAVPIFFIISGYFFFRKPILSIHDYFAMLRKKTNTLVIPFAFWNIVGLFILILSHEILINGIVTHPLNIFIKFLKSDYYAPLWYVQNLILYMILSPIFFWLLKSNMRILLYIVLIIEFFLWRPVDCYWFSSEGVLFFTIGGILQNSYLRSNTLNNYFFLFVILFFFLWIFISFGNFVWSNIYIHKFNTLLGVTCFWFILNYLPKFIESMFFKISVYSFIIYCSHFYILKTLKIGIAHFYFNNNIVSLISFLVLPIITIVIILLIVKPIKKIIPNAYKIVTGNR